MNSVWEAKSFADEECNLNQTEVVLLIYCNFNGPFDSEQNEADKKRHEKLKRSLLPFIRQNNYKILIFEGESGNEKVLFFLIKNFLRVNQKVKIVIFRHFHYINKCSNMLDMLDNFFLEQLPYSSGNLGLVLLENGEHKNWHRREETLSMDTILDLNKGMAWNHCVDYAYGLYKCEKHGCPGLKILINRDSANKFTNILLVRMTKSGKLGTSEGNKEKLEIFINDQLQFTPLTTNDVQIFQPDIFKILHDVNQQMLEFLSERQVEMVESIVRHVLGTTTDVPYQQSWVRETLPYLTISKKRSKRSSKVQVDAEVLYNKMLICLPSLSNRFDPFSVTIRNAILKLLSVTEADDEKKKQYMCELSGKTGLLEHEKTALEDARNYFRQQDVLLVHVFNLVVHANLDMRSIKIELNNLAIQLTHLYVIHYRKVLRDYFEKFFQSLIANFTTNWYAQTEQIENSVDRLTKKLTLWTDEIQIYNYQNITWDIFSNWIGMERAGLNFEETQIMFNANKNLSIDSDGNPNAIELDDFHWIRELLYGFNMNVTNIAIERLATSKLERVDAGVAVLDNSFMAGIVNLHQSIDSEQWSTIRPHIFYYLVRFQQNAKTFDNFLMTVKGMFDIHHIDMPLTPYARLQDIKAEFDVYQDQMEGYINGSINTSQQWGREFHETIDYMFKNSGTQHKSLINGAVKWIKEGMMLEQKLTWSGFDFEGTLVLINFIVQKCLKGRRFFW